MKVVTWNINSVRARIERLVSWLTTHQPDVVCLEEIKCLDEQFPRAEIEAVGYQVQTFGQKAYNGVALIARHQMTDVRRNMDDGDEHACVISAVIDNVRIVNVYAPNGQSLESDAYRFKLQWYERLPRWIAATQPSTKSLMVCGDMNVAPSDLDIYEPSLWTGQTLASEKERAGWRALVEAHNLRDAFRERHPEAKQFSWWDYRMGAFHRNEGLRIDHLLVSEDLQKGLVACEIDREARKGKLPSDHAPVWAQFA